jgi:O-antigen/teichoic acid export membrane protein
MQPESPSSGEENQAESAAIAAATAEPKRLAVNFAFLSAGEMTAKLLTFASFSFLAHRLGPANYGILEFTLAVMTFFTLPADLGLSWYGAREVARNPARGPRLLHEITGLRFALTLCSMAGLLIFILVIHKSYEQKELLGIYCVSLLATPFLLQWFFQAYDRMVWVAGATIVRQIGFAGLVFLCCRGGYSLLWVGFAECISVTCIATYCIFLTRYGLGAPWPWPDLHLGRLMGHIRESLPIGLSELSWAFMWYFCTVLLGLFYPDKSLGWFGASHRTVMAMHTFVALYSRGVSAAQIPNCSSSWTAPSALSPGLASTPPLRSLYLAPGSCSYSMANLFALARAPLPSLSGCSPSLCSAATIATHSSPTIASSDCFGA